MRNPGKNKENKDESWEYFIIQTKENIKNINNNENDLKNKRIS